MTGSNTGSSASGSGGTDIAFDTGSPADPGGIENVRRSVVLAGHLGDGATARTHLAHALPSVRVAALGALRRTGDLGPDDLSHALADPDPSVRSRAAELAAGHPGNRQPELVPLLVDAVPSVVEAAAWASGERQPAEPGAVMALSQVATDHGDALCRESAVAALGSLGDTDGLRAVLAATRDKPAVRRRAVLALAAFSGPEVDAALERASADRDWQVRQAAEDIG